MTKRLALRLTAFVMTVVLGFGGINAKEFMAEENSIVEKSSFSLFSEGDAITFADANFEKAIKASMNKSEDDSVTISEANNFTGSLQLVKKSIKNISGIEHFTSIDVLNLNENQITNIEPLSNLTQLRTLELRNNLIVDVSPLAELTGLLNLWINNNKISNIEPLENLTKLVELSLSYNYIADIKPLENMTNIEKLLLQQNKLKDIEPLSNMTKLSIVQLCDNELTSIEPLRNASALTEVYAEYNKISDISPLEDCTELTALHLNQNEIKDIMPLKKLTMLTSLFMLGNKIENIEVIENLTNLTRLELHNNQITDITPIRKISNLFSLSIGKNPIKSIDAIGENRKLQLLGISETFVTDISVIQYFMDLRVVYMESTPIDLSAGSRAKKVYDTLIERGVTIKHDSFQTESIVFADDTLDKVIRKIVGKPTGDIVPVNVSLIKTLDLSGLGIRSISGIESIESLEELVLADNPIANISALLKLPNLKDVDIDATNVKSDDEVVKQLIQKGVNVKFDIIQKIIIPTVEIDYETGFAYIRGEITTGTAFEYCVSTTAQKAEDKGKWEYILDNKISVAFLSGKKVYIRQIGAKSEIVEVIIANIKKPTGKPTNITFESQTLKVVGVDDSMEYRFGASLWNRVEEDATAIDVSSVRSGGIMEIRTMAKGDTPASAVLRLKIPTIPAAPNVSFNYTKGTFTGITARTRISVSSGIDRVWGTADDTWAPIEGTLKVYGGDILYFRNDAAKSTSVASKVKRLELGEAQATPQLIINYEKMTISNATDTMQYQIKKGETLSAWKNIKLTDGSFDISKLPSKTDDIIIYVREKGVAAPKGQTLGKIPSEAVGFTVKAIPVVPMGVCIETYHVYFDAERSVEDVYHRYEYSINGGAWRTFTMEELSGNNNGWIRELDGVLELYEQSPPYKLPKITFRFRLKGSFVNQTPPSLPMSTKFQ